MAIEQSLRESIMVSMNIEACPNSMRIFQIGILYSRIRHGQAVPPTLSYASTSMCLDSLHNQISTVPGCDDIVIITTQISHVRTGRMLSLGLLAEYRTRYKIGICIFPCRGLHIADPKVDFIQDRRYAMYFGLASLYMSLDCCLKSVIILISVWYVLEFDKQETRL